MIFNRESDARLGLVRRTQHLVENAVDAVSHHHLPFEGFEVDVAGPLLVPLGDQAVDETDDRCFVGDVDQVLWLEADRKILAAAGTDLLDHFPGLAGLAFEAAVDGGEDLLRRGDDDLDHLAGEDCQIVDRTIVAGIGQGHPQPAVAAFQRQDPVVLGEADRHQFEQLGFDLVRQRRQKLKPLLAGEGGGQVLGVESLTPDQDLAETAVVLPLQRQGRLDLGRRDLEVIPQDLPEEFPGHALSSPPSGPVPAAGSEPARSWPAAGRSAIPG